MHLTSLPSPWGIGTMGIEAAQAEQEQLKIQIREALAERSTRCYVFLTKMPVFGI